MNAINNLIVNKIVDVAYFINIMIVTTQSKV